MSLLDSPMAEMIRQHTIQCCNDAFDSAARLVETLMALDPTMTPKELGDCIRMLKRDIAPDQSR